MPERMTKERLDKLGLKGPCGSDVRTLFNELCEERKRCDELAGSVVSGLDKVTPVPAGTVGICLLDKQGTVLRSVSLKLGWNMAAVVDELKAFHGVDVSHELFEMMFHKFLNGIMLHAALWDLLGMGPKKEYRQS